jgi:hypothetical protein
MTKNDLETLLQGILSGAGRSLGEEVNGLLEPARAGSPPETDRLLSWLTEFRVLQQGHAEAVAANTQAALQKTVGQASSGGGSTLASVGKAVWSKLGAGATLSPLILGLMRLFGGGKPEPPPALVGYSRPPAIQFEGAVARSGSPELSSLGYDQYGRPRALGAEGGREDARSGSRPLYAPEYDQYGRPRGMGAEAGREDVRSGSRPLYAPEYDQDGWPRGTGEEAGREDAARTDYGQRAAAQITIQVQAMDSRSFQDHSAEIAQAVREAMLNSHVLNDVVNEL